MKFKKIEENPGVSYSFSLFFLMGAARQAIEVIF